VENQKELKERKKEQRRRGVGQLRRKKKYSNGQIFVTVFSFSFSFFFYFFDSRNDYVILVIYLEGQFKLAGSFRFWQWICSPFGD